MDLRGLRVTKNACFSLLTHTKQPLLVTLHDTTAGIQNLEVGCDADAERTDSCEGWNRYVDT